MSHHIADLAPAGQRTCKACGVVKPLDDYPRHSNTRGGVTIWQGHRVQCKACQAIKVADRFQRRKEAWRPAMHAWYMANYASTSWSRMKARAKKAGATQFLSLEEWTELKSGRTCHWCSIDLHPSFTHVDHVRPLVWGGQHTRDNLVLACANCNVKRDWERKTKYDRERP